MSKTSDGTIIYSAIIGPYDYLAPPRNDHSKDGVRYICFTDDVQVPAPWEIISASKILAEHDMLHLLEEPRRASRWFKFHPHLLFNTSTMYVDGTAKVQGDPRGRIEALDNPIAMFKHPRRSCVYEEERNASKRSRDKGLVTIQCRDYMKEGMPRKFGLHAGGVIMSRRDPEGDAFLEACWDEYMKRSDRDQLSIAYCRWKFGFEIDTLPERLDKNKYANVGGHHSPEAYKLNIGTRGRSKKKGWLNLDSTAADITARVPPLPERVTTRKWKQIVAIHFWEHLFLWEAQQLAGEIKEVLEPGGELILECPNIMSAVKGLSGQGPGGNKYIWWVLYGNPDFHDESYCHRWGYTPESLRQQLIDHGGFDPEHVHIEPAKYHVPHRDFRVRAVNL